MQFKAQPLYWEKEPPIFNLAQITEITHSGLKLDSVITHSCPSFCPPYSKGGINNWLQLDQKLAQDIENERQQMDDLWYELKTQKHPIKQWWYGHFHRSAWLDYEGCYFRLLDINEMDYLKKH